MFYTKRHCFTYCSIKKKRAANNVILMALCAIIFFPGCVKAGEESFFFPPPLQCLSPSPSLSIETQKTDMTHTLLMVYHREEKTEGISPVDSSGAAAQPFYPFNAIGQGYNGSLPLPPYKYPLLGDEKMKKEGQKVRMKKKERTNRGA